MYDEAEASEDIVIDARNHIVNGRRDWANQYVRKSPRYVAQFVARAARLGFKVNQFNDLSILVQSPDNVILLVPDEDSEHVYDFKYGDRVSVVGVTSYGKLMDNTPQEAAVAIDEHIGVVYAPPELINHVVEQHA